MVCSMIAYFMPMADFLPELNEQTLNFMRVIGGFDLCMAAIMLFVFFRGMRRGFSEELSRVLGLVIAIVAGLFALRMFGTLLDSVGRWSGGALSAKFVLALLIAVACFILWVVVANISSFCLRVTVNHKLDVFLGGLLGLLKALIIVFVICGVLYLQPNCARCKTLEESSYVFRVVRPLIEAVIHR
ncbi:MAG: CvpA family protein [Kiritimatiellia bacterium]